jgi:class 3 adenylate cyclase/CHASE2 domain-containing sensor protein
MNQVMLRSRGKAAAIAAIILVVSTALAQFATRPPSPFAAAERLFEAVAFRALGPRRPIDPRVVIAAITEGTLARLPYRSPVDRQFLASLIDKLATDGVAAIGLDVLLDRPTEADKDAALRQALLHASVPVVVISVAADTPESAEQRRFLEQFTVGLRSGDANLARERFDDVVRQHVPQHPDTGRRSFTAGLAEAVNVVPPTQPFAIEWRRSENGEPALPVYPAESIPLLPPQWLRGRIVLIGSMVPGSDEHRTPASSFGPPTFGVEIHGQILLQMLEHRAVPLPLLPWNTVLSSAGVAGIGMIAAALLAGWPAVLALVAVALVFLAGDLAIYATAGLLLPAIAPVLALAIAGGAVRSSQGRGDRRDRRALRTLFSRFVSGPVVDEIMRERDLFLAGGRPRPQELTATVMYADVAAFTSICERLEPAPLVAWLDRYIDTMAAIITAHEGVLLRFIGDGILAVFGVPVPRRDQTAIAGDACRAANCALTMERAMTGLNDEWRAAGLPEAGLRVGVHTGPMVAGSLGTGARMEFCLLGDTANVGARLEQLGKEFVGNRRVYCTIVVGGPTFALLGGSLPGLRMGDITLRGKRAPLEVYRIDSEAATQAAAEPASEALASSVC